MRNWSIPIGRLFGVEIRVHLTFVFLLALVWMAETAMKGNSAPGRELGLVGIIFGSVILHELGHALIARREGLQAKAIILLPIGGITLLEETASPGAASQPVPWKRDIKIAAAGPVVNIVIALVAAGVVWTKFPEAQLWMKPHIHSNHLLRSLVWANLFLGLFNLLPAYPMDGGRVLRALFSRTMDMAQATQRAVSVAHALATLLVVLGMLLFFHGDPDSYWLVTLGCFLLIGAQVEERSALFQKVLETVHLEDVMLTDFATLSPADTLEDALDKAVHTLQDDFPVVRGSDMVGVISKASILQALRAEGNGYVQSVMNRIFEVSSRSETLASAFRKLNSRNLSIIPVVEDQQLVGIVTLQNLMHSMALLAESRKLRREALES